MHYGYTAKTRQTQVWKVSDSDVKPRSEV